MCLNMKGKTTNIPRRNYNITLKLCPITYTSMIKEFMTGPHTRLSCNDSKHQKGQS